MGCQNRNSRWGTKPHSLNRIAVRSVEWERQRNGDEGGGKGDEKVRRWRSLGSTWVLSPASIDITLSMTFSTL